MGQLYPDDFVDDPVIGFQQLFPVLLQVYAATEIDHTFPEFPKIREHRGICRKSCIYIVDMLSCVLVEFAP